jgi:hypothetical protein
MLKGQFNNFATNYIQPKKAIFWASQSFCLKKVPNKKQQENVISQKKKLCGIIPLSIIKRLVVANALITFAVKEKRSAEIKGFILHWINRKEKWNIAIAFKIKILY